MSFNQKNKKQTQKGFILYTSLKNALESSGIDSMTAGQTAWLFVSFVIAGIFGIIAAFIAMRFGYYKISDYNDMFVYETLFFTMIFHFTVVMLRLKYLIVNLIFFGVMYTLYVVLKITDIYLLLCIGLALFVIYLLIPIYSWRIKILDGILYTLYAIIGWFIVHSYYSKPHVFLPF